MVRALLFFGEEPNGFIFRRSVDFVSAFTIIARAPTKKIATSIITVVNLFYLLFSVLLQWPGHDSQSVIDSPAGKLETPFRRNQSNNDPETEALHGHAVTP